MTKQEQFFYDNAGVGWNPQTETMEEGKTRGAVELAQAETWAAQEGLRFEWGADEDGCQCDDCNHADCQYCQLVDDSGAILAALCGICGATQEYERTVQAELAQEAMHARQRAQEAASAAPARRVTVSDLTDYLAANVENPGATAIFLTEAEAARAGTDEYITLESVYRQFQNDDEN